MSCISLVDRIDALLPQTQCTKCGYDGCRPYAQALARDTALINRCPPGGAAGVQALAALLDKPVLPLDPDCGAPAPLTVARIDEAHCIGCMLCIKACPVDAIVGANKLMHTVLNDWCTGCDLCVAPCPVDCIAMVPAEREWTAADATSARQRHRQRLARLQHNDNAGLMNSQLPPPAPKAQAEVAADTERKHAAIAAALARARARRNPSES